MKSTMSKWNHFGGDERYPVGQAYDQIHAIKLNRQMKFRRAYSAFGYEANTGKLQPLLSNLDEAIESLVKHLNIKDTEMVGKIILWERDKVVSFWKDRVQANIDERLEEFYFDLDSYASTVERITKPTVVQSVFCLYDSEAKALKDVSTYFKEGHNASPHKQNDYLFRRTIDRLLNHEGTDSCPHHDLSEDDIFSLASANGYLDNLNTAFRLTNPKK